MTPWERIDRASHRWPSRLAIQTAHASLTHAQLAREVARIAPALAKHVAPGDRVALLGSAPAMYASALAAVHAGAAYVPLGERTPVARNAEILSLSGARLAIVDRAEQRRLLPPDLPVLACDELAPGRGAASCELPPRAADSTAYVLFTSGSTGRPKGVPISDRSLGSFVDAVLEQYDFSERDRFLQMCDLGFDLSIAGFVVPLCAGASLYPVGGHGVAKILEVARTLAEREITVAFLVPSLAHHLLEAVGDLALPHLRYAIFCGEPLRHELAERWSRIAPRAAIENAYGPTEATVFTHRYRWRPESSADAVHGTVPIGTPLARMSAQLLTDPSAPDAGTGELCLIGPQVMDGYCDPSNDDAAFVTIAGARAYRTGDRCRFDARGDLVFLGRVDGQVKIAGHRVELAEIEFQARRFGCAPDCAALALERDGVQRLALAVSDATDTSALLAHLRRHLPAYMVPTQVHRVVIPLNANGKVDRRRLADLIEASPRETTERRYVLAPEMREERCAGGVRVAMPDGRSLFVSDEDHRYYVDAFRIPRAFAAVLGGAERFGRAHVVRALLEGGFLVSPGFYSEFGTNAWYTHLRRSGSRTLIVQFRGGSYDLVAGVPPGEFAHRTGLAGHDLLVLRDLSGRSYLDGLAPEVASLDSLAGWLSGFAAAARPPAGVCCMGTSMGAYAAIVFGHRLRAREIWAFAPSLPASPTAPVLADVVAGAEAGTATHVWYGERNPADRSVALSLAGAPGVHLHPLDTDSHWIVKWMADRGELPVLVPEPPDTAPRYRARAAVSDAELASGVARLVRELFAGRAGSDVELGDLREWLDSFSAVELLACIEEEFGLELRDVEIADEDLVSISAIAAMVGRAIGSTRPDLGSLV